MRVLLIIGCVCSIFVFTCTASFTELMEAGIVSFQWDAHPLLSELMAPLPKVISWAFLKQKIGHITAFFILTLLLQTKFKSKKLSVLLAGSYAIFTEFLQLYFSRDGRIFDIGIDLVGVLVSIGIGFYIKARVPDTSSYL